jgi:hypothetical protein
MKPTLMPLSKIPILMLAGCMLLFAAFANAPPSSLL